MLPLVVAYHLAPSVFAGLRGLVEVDSRITGDGSAYTHPGAVVRLLGNVGRPVVLVGWSAGAQGVRTHIEHGDLASVVAVIELDGAHASTPPQEARLVPWRQLLSDSTRKITMTSTRIVPPGYASTRTVLGALGLPIDDGVFTRDSGRVRVVNTPGDTAAEHILHNHLAAAEVARALGLPIPADAPPVARAEPTALDGGGSWGILAALLGIGAAFMWWRR